MSRPFQFVHASASFVEGDLEEELTVDSHFAPSVSEVDSQMSSSRKSISFRSDSRPSLNLSEIDSLSYHSRVDGVASVVGGDLHLRNEEEKHEDEHDQDERGAFLYLPQQISISSNVAESSMRGRPFQTAHSFDEPEHQSSTSSASVSDNESKSTKRGGLFEEGTVEQILRCDETYTPRRSILASLSPPRHDFHSTLGNFPVTTDAHLAGDLKRQLQALQLEKDEIEMKLISKEHDVMDIQQKLIASEHERVELEISLETSKIDMDQMVNTVDYHKEAQERAETKLASVETEMKQSHKAIVEIQSNLEEKNGVISKLSESVKGLEEALSNKHIEMEQKRRSLKGTASRSASFDATTLERQLRSREREINTLKSNFKVLKRNFDQATRSKEKAEYQLADNKTKLENWVGTFSAKEKKLSTLLNTVKVLEQALSDAREESTTKLMKAEEGKTELEASLQERSVALDTARNELEDLALKHDKTLRSIREEYEECLDEQEKKNEKIRGFWSDMKKAHEEEKEELQEEFRLERVKASKDYDEQIRVVQTRMILQQAAHSSNMEKLEEDLSNTKERISFLQDGMQGAQETIKERDICALSFQREIDRLNEELQSEKQRSILVEHEADEQQQDLSNQVQRMKAQIEDYKVEQDRVAQMEQHRRTGEKYEEELRRINGRLRKEKAQAASHVDKLTSQMTVAADEAYARMKSFQEQTKAEAEKEVSAVREGMDQLQTIHSEQLEQSDQALTELREELRSSKRDHELLLAQLREETGRAAVETQVVVDDALNRIKEMAAEHEFEKARIEASVREEKDADIRELKEELLKWYEFASDEVISESTETAIDNSTVFTRVLESDTQPVVQQVAIEDGNLEWSDREAINYDLAFALKDAEIQSLKEAITGWDELANDEADNPLSEQALKPVSEELTDILSQVNNTQKAEEKSSKKRKSIESAMQEKEAELKPLQKHLGSFVAKCVLLESLLEEKDSVLLSVQEQMEALDANFVVELEAMRIQVKKSEILQQQHAAENEATVQEKDAALLSLQEHISFMKSAHEEEMNKLHGEFERGKSQMTSELTDALLESHIMVDQAMDRLESVTSQNKGNLLEMNNLKAQLADSNATHALEMITSTKRATLLSGEVHILKERIDRLNRFLGAEKAKVKSLKQLNEYLEREAQMIEEMPAEGMLESQAIVDQAMARLESMNSKNENFVIETNGLRAQLDELDAAHVLEMFNLKEKIALLQSESSKYQEEVGRLNKSLETEKSKSQSLADQVDFFSIELQTQGIELQKLEQSCIIDTDRLRAEITEHYEARVFEMNAMQRDASVHISKLNHLSMLLEKEKAKSEHLAKQNAASATQSQMMLDQASDRLQSMAIEKEQLLLIHGAEVVKIEKLYVSETERLELEMAARDAKYASELSEVRADFKDIVEHKEGLELQLEEARASHEDVLARLDAIEQVHRADLEKLSKEKDNEAKKARVLEEMTVELEKEKEALKKKEEKLALQGQELIALSENLHSHSEAILQAKEEIERTGEEQKQKVRKTLFYKRENSDMKVAMKSLVKLVGYLEKKTKRLRQLHTATLL